jgi:hypothetical protein
MRRSAPRGILPPCRAVYPLPFSLVRYPCATMCQFFGARPAGVNRHHRIRLLAEDVIFSPRSLRMAPHFRGSRRRLGREPVLAPAAAAGAWSRDEGRPRLAPDLGRQIQGRCHGHGSGGPKILGRDFSSYAGRDHGRRLERCSRQQFPERQRSYRSGPRAAGQDPARRHQWLIHTYLPEPFPDLVSKPGSWPRRQQG